MISVELLTAVLFGCILIAFALGAQVGLALGGIAMLVGYFTWGDAVFNVVPTTLEDNFFNFILLSIPLYIYMGQLLTRSGVGEAMFSASQAVIGRVRGSLAISVIIVCSLIGAIGVIGAVLLAVIYRRFKPSLLRVAGVETTLLVAVAMWIIIGASVFSNFHLLMGIQGLVARFTADLGLPPWGVILLMQGIMLLLGFIIDEFIIVLMCAPIFTPIAVSLGYDPVWFGILMILNIEIAIQTPPYGFALFYLKGIAPPGVTMLDIYRSITPFVLIKLAVLMLCIVFPELVLWLPDRLMGPG
jgi:TRAP-type mannitol/chloroaromatic compound transport system permease large subunit